MWYAEEGKEGTDYWDIMSPLRSRRKRTPLEGRFGCWPVPDDTMKWRMV
jgi:hypothetical protein